MSNGFPSPSNQSPSVQHAPAPKPSSLGIWVGVGLMIVGIFAFVGLLLFGLTSLLGSLNDLELVSPGEQVAIEMEAGTHLVYTEDFAAPVVTILDESGEELPLGRVTFASTVTVNDFAGSAQAAVEVKTAGQYLVINDGDGPVVVGPPFVGKLFTAMLMPFGVGGVLFLAGLVVLTFSLIRRSKARRQVAPAPYTQNPPAPRNF